MPVSKAALGNITYFDGKNPHLIHLVVATFHAHELLEFEVDIFQLLLIVAARAHQHFDSKYAVPWMKLLTVRLESPRILRRPLGLFQLIGETLLSNREVELGVLQHFCFSHIFLVILVHDQFNMLKVVIKKLGCPEIAL